MSNARQWRPSIRRTPVDARQTQETLIPDARGAGIRRESARSGDFSWRVLVSETIRLLPVTYGAAFLLSVIVDIAVFEAWDLDFLQLAGLEDIFITSLQFLAAIIFAIFGFSVAELTARLTRRWRPFESVVRTLIQAAIFAALSAACFGSVQYAIPDDVKSISLYITAFLVSAATVFMTEAAIFIIALIIVGMDFILHIKRPDDILRQRERYESIRGAEKMYQIMRIAFAILIAITLATYQYNALVYDGFLGGRALRANVEMCAGARMLWRGSNAIVLECDDRRKVVVSHPEDRLLYAAEPNRRRTPCTPVKDGILEKMACFKGGKFKGGGS